jgi:hypothetical protein
LKKNKHKNKHKNKMEAIERSIERVKANDGKRRRDESEPKKPRKKRTNSEDLDSVKQNVEQQLKEKPRSKSKSRSVTITEAIKKEEKEKEKKKENLISLTFKKFIDETIQRLKESEKISLEQAIQIQSLLESKQLGNSNVSLDLQKELNRVCRIEYDEIQKNSDRLSGYGWSRTKIATHMKRKLQEKIDESMDVIQGFIALDSATRK